MKFNCLHLCLTCRWLRLSLTLSLGWRDLAHFIQRQRYVYMTNGALVLFPVRCVLYLVVNAIWQTHKIIRSSITRHKYIHPLCRFSSVTGTKHSNIYTYTESESEREREGAILRHINSNPAVWLHFGRFVAVYKNSEQLTACNTSNLSLSICIYMDGETGALSCFFSVDRQFVRCSNVTCLPQSNTKYE